MNTPQTGQAPGLSLSSYYVRLSDRPGAGHLISGAADAMEAAELFLERWCADVVEDVEVRVIVSDAFTGAQQCLVIHLGGGEIDAC